MAVPMVAIGIFVSDLQATVEKARIGMEEANQTILSFRQIIENLSDQVGDLKKQVNSLRSPSEASIISSNIIDLDSRLNSTENLIKIISTAITENPEKAMSIPLLRKDVLRIDQEISSTIVEVDKKIDRVYDLFMWFIPAFGGFALAVLGLVVKNLGWFS